MTPVKIHIEVLSPEISGIFCEVLIKSLENVLKGDPGYYACLLATVVNPDHSE